MKLARSMLLVGMLAVVPLAVCVGAGKSWTQSGAQAFSEGELDGVSLLSSGELVLAPPVEKIEGLDANYVWDIALGADDTAYVGTGAPAAVYVLKGGELKLLHRTNEQHVLSVLALGDGSVLAATTPRGIIYRIDAGGQVTVFQTLEDPYVWDMALGNRGEVYCATGPKGRLLRLEAPGKAVEVFKAQQSHLLCLAVHPGTGDVFVGSEPDGLVYRVAPGGAATVLYDADEAEVRALCLGPDGELYAGTAQAEAGAAPPPPEGPPAGPPPPQAPSGPRPVAELPGRPAAANSLYRIIPDQGGVRLAQFPNAFVLSVALLDGGEVVAGTGVEGRLAGVTPDGVMRVITDFDARCVSAMATDSTKSVIVGTSDGGGLWRLSRGYRNQGTFTSSVFDAGYLARWGRIWRKGLVPEGTAAAVGLRTGNVREPDDTWAPWSASAEQPAGRALEVRMGRFAQIRAELSTADGKATPRLFELAASYSQVNRRPQVQTLAIDGAAQPGAGPVQPGPPRPPDQPPGTRTVRWEASDPDEDEIVFDLFYRAADEADWKELKRGIKGERQYLWDTRRVPDGDCLLRVVASDRPARAEGEALEAEKVTAPFVIDNRSPEVLELKEAALPDGRHLIMGLARDSFSNIVSIEASHNSGEWQPVFPEDGIFDAAAEQFAFRTGALGKGEHVFVFAATDAAQNTGSQRLVIRVP